MSECLQCKKGFGSTCFETHQAFIDHEVEMAADALRADGSIEWLAGKNLALSNPTNVDPDRYAIKLQEAFKGMQAPASDLADAFSYAGRAMRGFGSKVCKKSGS